MTRIFVFLEERPIIMQHLYKSMLEIQGRDSINDSKNCAVKPIVYSSKTFPSFLQWLVWQLSQSSECGKFNLFNLLLKPPPVTATPSFLSLSFSIVWQWAIIFLRSRSTMVNSSVGWFNFFRQTYPSSDSRQR